MSPERLYSAHPQSVPGDFYVVNNECLGCGAPHAVAPDLMGWAESADPKYCHCIWKKQPETTAELEQAFAAFAVSEIDAFRYAGSDAAIIERLGTQHCDQSGCCRYAAIEKVAVPHDFSFSGYASKPLPRHAWFGYLRRRLWFR